MFEVAGAALVGLAAWAGRLWQRAAADAWEAELAWRAAYLDRLQEKYGEGR